MAQSAGELLSITTVTVAVRAPHGWLPVFSGTLYAVKPGDIPAKVGEGWLWFVFRLQ